MIVIFIYLRNFYGEEELDLIKFWLVLYFVYGRYYQQIIVFFFDEIENILELFLIFQLVISYRIFLRDEIYLIFQKYV